MPSSENVNDFIKSSYKISAYRATAQAAPDGTLWLARVSRQWRHAVLEIAPHGCGEPTRAITRRAQGISTVRLACAEDGRPLAVWLEITDAQATLMYAVLGPRGWSSPAAIPAPPGRMGRFDLINDLNGAAWLAFESAASGRRHILVSWYSGGQWAFAQRVSDGDGHGFAPAMCVFGEGARLVWDARIDGRYGIFMRELDAGADLSQRESQAVVATAKTLLANATIAAIDEETSVVAWERAQDDWGARNLVFRASRGRMSEGNFLMARRTLEAAVIGPRGIAGLSGEMNARFDATLPSAVRTAPKLAAGPDGSLWLSFRQIIDLAEAKRHHGFSQVLTAYRDGDWSEPMVLSDSAGDCDLDAHVTRGPGGGVLLNWMARRKGGFQACAGELPAIGPAGKLATGRFKTMKVPRPDAPTPTRIRWMGEPYGSPRLLWGDLHRHTSLSGCRWWCEGSPGDAYRYALSAAGLDFLALTDHGWDLASPDTRAHLFDLAAMHNVPGLFTAFCSYEMSLTGGNGHMVVLTGGSDPMLPEADTRKKLYAALRGSDAVIVPHHMGDPQYPYAWKGHDDAISPVAEIYQPYRTAFEQSGAPAPATAWVDEGNAPLDEGMLVHAWRAGHRLGVVASSDHLSTGGAYAAVWAESNTRQGILEALRLRRCYGATRKVEIDFRCEGRPMGAAVEPAGPTMAFSIDVRNGGKLKRADLLAGGEVVKTFKPAKSGSKIRETCKLDTPRAEQFYYLRVELSGGDMAWTSPVWVAGG